MQYLVVIEKAKNNYSAYVPDLPGCIATGRTKRQVEKEMAQAIEFHIEGLKEDGYKIPRPSTESTYIALTA
jgi:predicted RNase H-like HicB family nuclease